MVKVEKSSFMGGVSCSVGFRRAQRGVFGIFA
jgi:hypothetical protein